VVFPAVPLLFPFKGNNAAYLQQASWVICKGRGPQSIQASIQKTQWGGSNILVWIMQY
jgi:hypothetical protein